MTTNQSQQMVTTMRTLMKAKRRVSVVAMLLCAFIVAVLGCSRAEIVGEWIGKHENEEYRLTIFSDGTGDAVAEGKPTKPLTWRRVKDGFELAVNDATVIGTLRENGTLAIRNPQNPDLGLLILKRSKINP